MFLSGCLQIKDKFKLESYAHDCVNNTMNWSSHWKNNRSKLPRDSDEPLYAKYIERIDQLLVNESNSPTRRT